jgi:acetyltransferase-like isoleucine patch superfamily enzyme
VGNLVGPIELIHRIKFWGQADRLGPDFPTTHWRLHFKTTGRQLCESKFKYFGVGAEFRPGAYAEACSKISIGKDVIIRPGTFLFADPSSGGAGITIEDGVLIGAGVHFYTNNHEYSQSETPIIDQGYPPTTENDAIVVKSGCWIGAGVIVLPGVTIASNTVVGAGSVVTKSISAPGLYVGNPARIINKN